MSDSAAAPPSPQAEGFEARDSPEFDRGVSFFDAIYGFAVTLLIANVDAPPAEAWRSLDALAASAVPEQLLGFALSFIVIALFWRVNVGLTRLLRGLDGVTTFINLIAAALVILIAFTTQGMSDHRSADFALPTAFYALNIALVSLAQIAFFQVARARGLERVPTSTHTNRWNLVNALLTPAIFVASVPVALFVDASLAKWIWALLIVVVPLGNWLTERAIARG